MLAHHFCFPLIIGLATVVSLSQACTNILMIGNSYTHDNDLGGKLQSLLDESDPTGCFDVVVDTAGGRRWERTYINQMLQQRDYWNFMIVQEQSRVSGFHGVSVYNGPDYYERSTRALRRMANGLNDYNLAQGGPTPQVVLYMTWGRENGDRGNAAIYGTYLDMQTRVTAGYEQYYDMLMDEGLSVLMAPVGVGFLSVYNEEIPDPDTSIAAGERFASLYANDGSHPSNLASYMAALTFVPIITRADPRLLTYSEPGWSLDDNVYFSEVAAAAVKEFYPSAQEFEVIIRIVFDSYSNENGWWLRDVARDETVGKRYRPGDFPWYDYGRRPTEWTLTLESGRDYLFIMEDNRGDGLGGAYQIAEDEPAGYSVIRADTGEILAQGANFGYTEEHQLLVPDFFDW